MSRKNPRRQGGCMSATGAPKLSLGKRSAAGMARTLRQRPYRCPNCGRWHLTTLDHGARRT